MSGLRRRRPRDKTSVSGVDFPFLILRDNRKDTRSRIATTMWEWRGTDDIDAVKDEFSIVASGYSAYYGFMTENEAFDQSLVLPPDTYFIYSVYRNSTFTISAKTDIYHEIECEHIHALNAELATCTAWSPYNRENGLIFQKKLRKRVKPAIDCWGIIGRRLRVVRDIRIMISRMVWEGRGEWMH